MQRRLIDWITTPLFVFSFGAIIGGMHPFLLVLTAIGLKPFRAGAALMNWLLLWALRIVSGAKISFSIPSDLPKDRPLIVVSNHQSMFDITFLILMFHRHSPRFVSKVELSRYIPSVSLILRFTKMALIDRKNPRQAIPTIEAFGRDVETHKHAACIFPEGTRARDGVIKPFKPGGVSALLKSAPSALVVPVAIDGSWELLRHKMFPVPYGVRIRVTALDPIEPAGRAPAEILQECESRITATVKLWRGGAST